MLRAFTTNFFLKFLHAGNMSFLLLNFCYWINWKKNRKHCIGFWHWQMTLKARYWNCHSSKKRFLWVKILLFRSHYCIVETPQPNWHYIIVDRSFPLMLLTSKTFIHIFFYQSEEKSHKIERGNESVNFHCNHLCSLEYIWIDSIKMFIKRKLKCKCKN